MHHSILGLATAVALPALLSQATAGGTAVTLIPCTKTDGIRLTWGGAGVEDKLLQTVSSHGQTGVRVQGRVVSRKGNAYLGARFPIPKTDLRNRQILVTVASPEAAVTRALYVRLYNVDGKCCGSWVNWNGPFTAPTPRVFQLHPAYMPTGFSFERKLVKASPAAVTAVEIIIGARAQDHGKTFAATVERIAFDPTPLTSILDLRKPKRLVLRTPLVEDGKPAAVILVPPPAPYQEVAKALADGLEKRCGVHLPIQTVPMAWKPPVPTQNALVLGDLNSNALAARLYALGYGAADAFYPGAGGCVVRTIHDPWGQGVNVILLGASDPAGLRRAVETFLGLLPKTNVRDVPRLFKLVPGKDLFEHFSWLGKPPGTPSEFARKQVIAGRAALNRGHHTGVFSTISTMGIRYLWTGDDAYARAFVELLFLAEEFRDSDPKTYGGPWGMDSDFMAKSVLPAWDNVEESPVLTAEDRLKATRILARWISEAVAPKAHSALTPPRVRFNHKTFPALGCWFAGRYLSTYYPTAVEGPAWLRLGQVCFSVQAQAFKPMEDCNGYQWLTLGHMIQYALAARDPDYFQTGNAARDADYAILTMDNFGYQTPYGDTGSFKCWFSELPFLREAAWYYDLFGTTAQRGMAAEYAWALDKKSAVANVVRMNEFARSIPSRVPTRLLGAKAWPLDPFYYKTFPDPKAPPLERCVDKVLMRNGFDKNDAYLLLDGLNNGGHKHYDGNTISRITALGRIWLADNDYYKAQPKFHNGVLVFRNGQGQTPPQYCELVRCTDLPAIALSQTTLHDYAGADWRRSILWVKALDLFFVADDFLARQAGDFMFQTRWHGVGQVRQTENGMELEQDGARFLIQAATDAAMQLEDNPELGTNWRGYPYAEPVVRDLTETARAHLAVGRHSRTANLLCAVRPTRRPITVQRAISPGFFVLDGLDAPAILGVSAPTTESNPNVNTQNGLLAFGGAALWLTQDRLAGFGITDLRISDSHVAMSAPVDFDLPAAPGAAGVLVCGVRTTLRFDADTAPGVTVDGRTGTPDPARGDMAFYLDSGRHTLAVTDSLAASLYDVALQVAEQARPAKRLPPHRPKPLDTITLNRRWTWRTPQTDYLLTGNRDRPEAVDAGASLKVDPPPRKTNVFGDTPNSANALCDGDRLGSSTSTQWDPDQTVTAVVSFPAPVIVDRLVLWHWYAEKTRKHRKFQLGTLEVELSSDGFKHDVRKAGQIKDTARHPDWGRPKEYGPVKYEVPGDGTPTSAVRIRVVPRSGAAVYIAELEIWGKGEKLRPAPGHTSLPVFPVQALAPVRTRQGTDAILCGGSDGGILLLRPNGTGAWNHKLAKSVRTVAAADLDADGKPELIVGGDDATVHCFDAGGHERWQARPDQYKSTPVVRVLLTPTVDMAGHRIVVAGADNWRYTAFDAGGKRLWHCESVHRSTAGATPDLDGDGIQDVFCGTEYYWWPAVRSTDGKKLWAYSTRSGPGTNAAAAGDLDGDGKEEVVAGGADGNLHALDDNGRLLWLYNTGDEVTAVLCSDLDGDGRKEVVAASLGFDVVAVNGKGERLWRLDTGAPVKQLCELRKPLHRFVFANADGTVGILDPAGRLLGTTALGSTPTAMIAARLASGADSAVIATADGRVMAIEPVGKAR